MSETETTPTETETTPTETETATVDTVDIVETDDLTDDDSTINPDAEEFDAA